MHRDFRSHLEFLEKNRKLLKVKKEVDLCFDIAAGTRKISDIDGPALLFENITGFPSWRVASGVYATQSLIALAIGLPADADEDNIVKRYLEFDQGNIKPRRVTTGPVKEILIKEEDIDLSKLPIPTYSELDAGPYLTAGVEVAKHHRTGIQNISIHRRMILDNKQTTLMAPPSQHLGMMIEAAEKDGIGLPVATVLGAPPAYTIATCVGALEGVDEAGIAGAIQGEPIKVVKCETSDIEVPADAEIVIEGVVVPNERVLCGPFGEFPGNYITMLGADRNEVWLMKTTAITMRKEAIFQAMLTGMPLTENHTLKKWAYTALAHRVIDNLADVKAINITRGGTAHYHHVVAIKKKNDEEPKKIIDAMLKARHGPVLTIVVDDDINVYDPVDVEWAIATRMRPDKDIIILSSDTSKEATLTFGKWGIDATVPIKDKPLYKKIKVPGMEKVDYV